MSDTVFVTGASGTTGRELVRMLTDRDVQVRAGVHTPATADFGPGVDVREIDLTDADSLRSAFDGVSRLYLLTPFVPDGTRMVRTAVDAAVETGVEYVVRHSALGAGTADFLPARWHREGEEAVEESGLAYTHLRPTAFMQNLLMQAGAIGDGAFYGTVTEPISHVDARDVAAVAAAVLTGEPESHAGEAYHLTGPAALTYEEVASELSDALGRDVRYVQVSEADMRGSLAERGMPAELVDAFLELQAWFDAGNGREVYPDVEAITGVAATPFGTFAADYAEAFRG
jgi:uncharacterized protein YbjT (DUF2867 family)